MPLELDRHWPQLPPRGKSPRVIHRRAAGGTLLVWLLVLMAEGQAQLPQLSPRPTIILPPSYGATPYSAQVMAEASYLIGLGSLLESEAHARLTHAAAAEHEIRNSLLWVETYFARKEVNRAYWKKYHPGYLDQRATGAKSTERKISELPQVALEGDPTDELNFMLEQVAADTLARELLDSETSMLHSEFDELLADGDLGHIRLTDGGREGGQMIVYRANDARLLETNWPRALRDAELAQARADFEQIRDRAVAEVKEKKELSWDTARQLCESVDALTLAFQAAYPPSRKRSSEDFLVYRAGERYLKSLAAGVFRLVDSTDTRMLDGTYEFQGDSVVGLIGHLCRYGLEFASPEKGSEGTYRKLFFAMRRLYEHLNQREEAEEQGREEALN